MKLLRLILLLLLFQFAYLNTNAQACSSLGQTPATSFPACGLNTFVQNNVPLCNGTSLPCPPCSAGLFADRNPYWYKFTCFISGTLGFTITPNNLTDDYDWQLFDVTGHNVNDVYTDASLFVCCNWSGTSGITGASAAGTITSACEGNQPTFTRMPTLIAGHDYLLMVSHFTSTQSGYTLAFGGGTTDITDTNTPAMQSAKASCDGKQVFIKLNKSMKCSSLTTTGSEFSIGSSSSVAAAAFGVGCSNSFDMDSVVVTLMNPLPTGNYSIVIHNGTDLNTLLDNCGTAIPASSQAFTVTAATATLMDSISPVPCSANSVQLVFKKPILCSSIAADGSDFIVTGPAPITVTSANGICGSDGLTNTIKVNFSTAISTAGNYQIKLIKGIDNNTLLNECNLATLINSTLSFVGLSAANAAFTFQIAYGCKADTVSFLHNGANGVNQLKWTFDDNTKSTIANPVKRYTIFGSKPIKLWVTNGICSDSTTQNIDLPSDSIKANFIAPEFICPNDMAVFVDSSKGNVTSWNWDFANGFTSNLQVPASQIYPPVLLETKAAIRLIAGNISNCYDTVYKSIKLIPNCNIAVPTAFTPNGDGLNDYLYPLFAYKADKLTFRVYNRYGQLVFITNDWTNKWDGKLSGKLQDTGVYVWMLEYTNRDTGKPVFQKGTSVLMR